MMIQLELQVPAFLLHEETDNGEYMMAD